MGCEPRLRYVRRRRQCSLRTTVPAGSALRLRAPAAGVDRQQWDRRHGGMADVASHDQTTGISRKRRAPKRGWRRHPARSEEHTSELQSHVNLVCRLLLEKKKKNIKQ